MIRHLLKIPQYILPLIHFLLICYPLAIFYRSFTKKRIILIDCLELQYATNIIPIVQEMRTRNYESIFFLCTMQHYIKHKDLEIFNIPTSRRLESCFARLLPAHVFLAATWHVRGHANSIKIHVGHAYSPKFTAPPKNDFESFEYHFSLGELSTKYYENARMSYNSNNVCIHEVGDPKFDRLFSNAYNKNDILHSLSLDVNKLTLLYAPSWDQDLSIRTFSDKIIDAIKILANTNQYNIIIKLHPCSMVNEQHPEYLFYTGGTNWLEKFQQGLLSCTNVSIIAEINYDPSPLLFVSDFMLTDCSSIATVFFALGKPTIYFKCDDFFNNMKDTYTKWGFGDNLDNANDFLASAGRSHKSSIVIDNPSEIMSALQFASKHAEEIKSQRQEMISKLHANMGNASKYACDAIIHLLDNGRL